MVCRVQILYENKGERPCKNAYLGYDDGINEEWYVNLQTLKDLVRLTEEWRSATIYDERGDTDYHIPHDYAIYLRDY